MDASSGFRKTRSGQAFSPWVADVGVPIHAPQDFDFEAHLKAAEDREAQRESRSRSTDSESDDVPLATLSKASAHSMHSTHQLAASVHSQEARLPAIRSLAKLKESAAARSQRGVFSGSQTGTSSTHASRKASLGDNTISKEKYHSRQRSKARRRQTRAASEPTGESVVGKRQPKGAALRRRAAAITLQAAVSLEPGSALVLASDIDAGQYMKSVPITTSYSLAMEDVPVCKTAYIAKRAQLEAEAGRCFTAQELVDMGFDYISWDGSQPRPILSREGRVIAVLAGHPRDENWSDVNAALEEMLETAREAYQPTAKENRNRRGDFIGATCGISYGGGQKHPRNVSTHGEHNAEVLRALCSMLPVKRVANFGNSAFQLFAPELHEYYRKTLDGLCHADSKLHPNFDSNVFANITFNLGPRTVSVPHRDFLNLSFGLCAITAVGTYDPTKSGQIILWEMRMVIEFPPTASMLIPSAIVTHSNTGIGPDERRYSITQYSAGGLFRWVEDGYRPAKDTPRMKPKEVEAHGRKRWEKGVAMLPLWKELISGGNS